MLYTSFELGRTGRVFAAGRGFFFILNELRLTDRTLRWKLENARVLGTILKHGRHDFGNYVAPLFKHDEVAYPNVFARDVIGVVQAGAAYRRSGKGYRLQNGYGRNCAGASDL